MTRSLVHITSQRGRFDDAVKIGPIAKGTGRVALKDRHAEAVVLRNLGGALLRAGQPTEAINQLQAAQAAYKELGDLVGEATTLTGLGAAFLQADRSDEAVTMLRAAVAAHHRARRPCSQAIALGNLGGALMVTGQLDEAIEMLRKADRIPSDRRPTCPVFSADEPRWRAAQGRPSEGSDQAVPRRGGAGQRGWETISQADTFLAMLADTYRETGQHTEANAILQDLGN